MDNSPEAASLAQGLRIVRLVIDREKAGKQLMGVSQLAAELDMDQSRVSRLTQELCELGLLERRERGPFRVGTGFFGLAATLNTGWIRHAAAELEALVATTGLRARVSVRDGYRVILLLASSNDSQAGSFVPAARATIGIVDRLFSRVGASDNLARGRSTFMVEMVETAAILSQAGPNSLVILDEIGRGTSTYDGLAIAWAVVEAMHDQIKCRTLFATHYHELTRLASRLDCLSLHHVRAREWKGDLVLLHEVAAGAADRSYGIAVAKLAGLPASVVARARSVLAKLEAGRDATGGIAAGLDDLPLFAAAAEPEQRADQLAAALNDLDPDSLTPREALESLYRLKKLAAEQGR